jgi:cytoskeletal protein RodZ
MVGRDVEMPVFGKQAGHKLREARLRRRMSVDQVATKLRIPPKYLLALEEGDLSVFSAEVYAKGAYVKYASYLKMDSRDSWHAFLRTLAGVRQTTSLKLPVPSTWLQRVLTPTGVFVAMVAFMVLLVVGYIGLQVSTFVRVPELELLEPEAIVLSEQEVMVKGIAEADAEVSVNREKVLLDDNNRFVYKLPLRPGINVLQVEAVGASGRTNVIEKHLLVPRS